MPSARPLGAAWNAPSGYASAAYRRVALFPVGGATALAASRGSTSFGAGSLLPLPSSRASSASRSTAQNAPLWALVSLGAAFLLLWSSTLGIGHDVPLVAPVGAFVEDGTAAVRTALRRIAVAVPAAPSVVLARLRLGQPALVVEVDGKSVRARDAAQIEAALAAAGLQLESGDRIIAVPNTGRQLVQRAIPFSVLDGGVPFSHRVAADTVADALASAGIALHDADVVAPPHESPLVPGMHITVVRAQPVRIVAPDLLLEARSRAGTVGELLFERGVALGPLDRVDPSLESALPVQGAVRIVRGREEEQREVKSLPFQTRIQYSDDLPPGVRQRIRGGVAGLVERLVRVLYEDSAEVRRDPIQERVVRVPVDEVILAARIAAPAAPLLPIPALPAPAFPGGPDMPVRRVVNMVATAYDAGPISTGKSPGHPAYGITATGMRATYGVVAVDPRVIPFFTRLYVPGYGYAIAADTGGDIKGNRIDLFYPSYSEALQWGRQTVPVYILD